MTDVTFEECLCPHGYYTGAKVDETYVCNHGDRGGCSAVGCGEDRERGELFCSRHAVVSAF